ncbi:MAG: cell envelope integrity protein CreD [Synergistaceae bacterium]|jgi:inner membrane protein|nr:cell envelope integrity protein CreD [Synergistaceae bacterium]
MIFGFLFGGLMLLVCFAIAAAGVITGWWIWRRMTLPEGEPAPKWGDLSALRNAAKGQPMILGIIAVAIIAYIMTIPMGYIEDLTDERRGRYQSVADGIASTWGSPQTFTGPVLYVPYTMRYQVSEEVPLTAAELTIEQSRGGTRTSKEVRKTVEENSAVLVLPDKLTIDGAISTEERYRSIYTARVYSANLKVSGNFLKSDISGMGDNIVAVHWDRATLLVGITETKAIRSRSELTLGGRRTDFLPGTGGVAALPTGFSGNADLSAFEYGDSVDFNFEISVGGTSRLMLTPIGVSSVFSVSSEWPHPNFIGSGLPSKREITESGFKAEWEVPNLVRNYPQIDDVTTWFSSSGSNWRYAVEASDSPRERASDSFYSHDLAEYTVGVEFFETVFLYSLLTRATKYGILFIALMFLGVLIFDNYYGGKNKSKLAVTQYVIIGAGLALFYLTLLAASEHIGFNAAYAAAAAINAVMTGGYVASAMRDRRPAAFIMAVQALLYAFLFFILRMEDYALISGTALLVAATAALMFVTRNVNRPAGKDNK